MNERTTPARDASRPIVLVSKCLGFDACRYDGQKLNDGFVGKLALHSRFELVCPENLSRQTFFEPYPQELMEMADSGKGRATA